MGEKPIVMKNVSRTQAAKAGKRKPWWKGEYQATAKKEIAKPEEKIGKYYSAEDKKVKLNNNKANNKQTKLKASLVPGAVVILLAGRFKGKRAVFLKQLDSGLCLITGPFTEDEAKKPLDDAAKALQAKVDGGVKLDDDLKGYLKSKFGLSRADVPHEMSF